MIIKISRINRKVSTRWRKLTLVAIHTLVLAATSSNQTLRMKFAIRNRRGADSKNRRLFWEARVMRLYRKVHQTHLSPIILLKNQRLCISPQIVLPSKTLAFRASERFKKLILLLSKRPSTISKTSKETTKTNNSTWTLTTAQRTLRRIIEHICSRCQMLTSYLFSTQNKTSWNPES